MTNDSCPRGEAILAAVRESGPNEEIESHAAECPTCADLLLVESVFGNESVARGEEVDLPDPRVIWWRARRQLAAERLERATRPIRWLEIASLAGGTAVLAGLFFRFRHLLTAWLSGLAPAWAESVPTPSLDMTLVVTVAGTVLAGLLAYGIYSQAADG